MKRLILIATAALAWLILQPQPATCGGPGFICRSNTNPYDGSCIYPGVPCGSNNGKMGQCQTQPSKNHKLPFECRCMCGEQ